MAEKIGYAPAGIAETFYLDWRTRIVNTWRADTQYAIGAIVRPPETKGNGFYYEATTAGLSAYLTPAFPAAADETVRDGSVVWTARHPSTPSLESIQSSQWTLDEGATEEDSDIDGFITWIKVIGATAGEQYRLTNRITRSTGEEEEDSIVLETLDPPDV